MKILWCSWKDRTNPLTGGAEVVTEQLIKRLAADGHQVILLTAGYNGAGSAEEKDGYRIIRVGGRWTVYYQAFLYYRKNLRDWPDLIIEEINTVPFFTQLYAPKKKRFLFFHMLCREIWFYQMFFPLNLIGYLAEAIYLRILNRNQVITVSKSTEDDLLRFGFLKERIQTISEGTEVEPIKDLNAVAKYSEITVLSLGANRAMKRPFDQLYAFEIAKKIRPDLKLIIAGSGSDRYYQRFVKRVESSPYKKDITRLGWVSREKKYELMQKCHLITVTSIKEGWGLIVTEANSQGTIAAVYDADGLRDSTRDGTTGLVAKENTPAALAEAVVEALSDMDRYERFRESAWRWSKEINFDNSYNGLIKIINETE